MLHTARIALVSLVCVFALACGGKEDKPAPTKAEQAPAKTDKVPDKAKVPAAAQAVTGLTADPTGAAAEGTTEDAPAETASGLAPDLEKLADKACACKNAACANGVQDEVAKLMAEAKKPSPSEAKTIATIMQRLQGCVAAAQQK